MFVTYIKSIDVELGVAKAIAHVAHKGQTDKAGEPYISHPERVASNVEYTQDKIVAWLHDVVEDSSLDLDFLKGLGLFTDRTLQAIDAITHRKSETDDDYYMRVKQNEVALRVKLEDIEDNSDPARLAKLDDKTQVRLIKKYAHAKEVLLSEEKDEL